MAKTKLTPQQAFLVAWTNAKASEDAKPQDYLVSWTQHHMYILSPRSTITKSRKVLFQLPA